MSPTHPIHYSALYANSPSELLKQFPPIHKNIYGHHSTITFMPENIDGLEVGKKVVIKILGRATDDKGDVLLVENSKSKNKYPHITVSCSGGVRPEYSNELLEKSHKDGTIEIFGIIQPFGTRN